MIRAYDEIVAFIAGADPASVASFQASEPTKERVADLIRREKNEGLSAEETEELNSYLQLEHIMRLAKAEARLRLSRD